MRDTCNLLADGIVKLLRVLSAVANTTLPEWAEAQGYGRYLGSSIKGEAAIDWSDRKARRKLLGEIVADADRLLELARQAWVELPEDSAQRQSIVDGAELLGQLLLQDIERKSDDGDVDDEVSLGVSLKDGVSKDRMLSVHDPEMRHGHKSSRRRFNGHKAAIVVDTDSQLITAMDLLPGNAPNNRMTFTLTWPRAVTPVRRGRLPTQSCRWESGLTAPVPKATDGGRTQVGAAGPVRDSPVPLPRLGQDEIPAVSGRHGGQPDPGVG